MYSIACIPSLPKSNLYCHSPLPLWSSFAISRATVFILPKYNLTCNSHIVHFFKLTPVTPPPSLVNCFAETLEGVWGFKSQTICPLHILQWFYNEHFTYLHHSLVSEDWLYCTWACGPKLGMETVCLSGSHFHVPK